MDVWISLTLTPQLLADPKKRAAFGKNKSRIEDLIDGMAKRKNAKGKVEANTDYQNKGFQHGKMGW